MAVTLQAVMRLEDQMSGRVASSTATVSKAQGAFGAFGRQVAAVGTGFLAAQLSVAGLQKGLSSTIGAAAAYEHQLAQIRGLTGATKEDTDKLSKSILSLARSTPKSARELGSAAYFIISAGITDAADASKVLEASTRAATAGLGETAVVADAVTSILNAYKLSADKAELATDQLVTTVRLGKTEASALAGSIGRILPVAAAMGVSFEEVGANLAVMTRVGLSADEAATSLRATLATLLKPTSEAEEALLGMGTSAEALRQKIREDGLLATLQELLERTGGNEAEIAKIIPNVRALVNVLGTAKVQGDTYVDTLDEMRNATGATDKAFAEVADTTQFKMQTAMSSLNVSLMQLGTTTLPLVARVAEDLDNVLRLMSGDAGAVKPLAEEVGRLAFKFSGLEANVNQAKFVVGAVSGLFGGSAKQNVHDFAEVLENADDRVSILVPNLERMKESMKLERERREAEEMAAAVAEMELRGRATTMFYEDTWGPVLKEVMTDTALESGKSLDEIRAQFPRVSGDGDAMLEALERSMPEAAKIFEELRDAADEQFQGVKDAIESVLPTQNEEFDAWRERLEQMADDYRSWESNLARVYDAVTAAGIESPEAIISALADQGPEAAAKFAQFFAEDPEAALEGLKVTAPLVVGETADEIVKRIVGIAPEMDLAVGVGLRDPLLQGIRGTRVPAGDEIALVGGEMKQRLHNELLAARPVLSEDAKQMGQVIGVRLHERLSAWRPPIGEAAKQLGDVIGVRFSGSVDGRRLGEEVGEGIASGLSSWKQRIIGEAEEWAKGLDSAFKQALGIQSPSRVAMEWGEEVAAGFALGAARASAQLRPLEVVASVAASEGPTPASFLASVPAAPLVGFDSPAGFRGGGDIIVNLMYQGPVNSPADEQRIKDLAAEGVREAIRSGR